MPKNSLLKKPEVSPSSLLTFSESVHVDSPPATAFALIRRIGGDTGWYYGNWLWRVRGWMDLAIGGAGLRRGRPDPDRLAIGDAVDCMRVEAIESNRLLRFAFEMRVPGCGWLQFEVEPNRSGSIIRQTAVFEPRGFVGRAYWYLIYPVHAIIFRGMIRSIAERSKAKMVRGPA